MLPFVTMIAGGTSSFPPLAAVSAGDARDTILAATATAAGACSGARDSPPLLAETAAAAGATTVVGDGANDAISAFAFASLTVKRLPSGSDSLAVVGGCVRIILAPGAPVVAAAPLMAAERVRFPRPGSGFSVEWAACALLSAGEELELVGVKAGADAERDPKLVGMPGCRRMGTFVAFSFACSDRDPRCEAGKSVTT